MQLVRRQRGRRQVFPEQHRRLLAAWTEPTPSHGRSGPRGKVIVINYLSMSSKYLCWFLIIFREEMKT